MVNATMTVMLHLSHGSSGNGWNICHPSNALHHAQCMLHVWRVPNDLTSCMNPKQDENNFGHLTMGIVKLEEIHFMTKWYRRRTYLVVADPGDNFLVISK
jgi:hypothetical protein